ncbi:hypothetical protein BDZ89DRAFT_834611 [Hymenopellis radicata]|nr:hypothetical protein BDZ89DRAFT_834611 [Hymenopellis radicata]
MQLIKRIRTSSSKLNIRISAKISHKNKQKDVTMLPDLPLEVWQIIFAFATFVSLDMYYGREWLLNPPSDDDPRRIHFNTRYQLTLVCKEWQAASLRFLYASIVISDWDHVPFVLHALETSRERDDDVPLGWFTKALVIPCNVLDETRDQTLIARILRCLPNLRYLRLSTTKPSLTFVENHVIDVLCTSCLGLEVLETTEYVAILPYGSWSVIFDSLKSLHSFTTTFIQPRFASDVDALTSAAASSSVTYLHLHISPSDVANADLSVPTPELCSLQTWVYDVDVTDDADFHRNVMRPTLVAYRTQLSQSYCVATFTTATMSRLFSL